MEARKVKILLDNGHGQNTPGKRSPDGSILEYAYARKIVKAVHDELKAQGYDVTIITPEEWDISIGTRVSRINQIARTNTNCLAVSVHLNAAGIGKWMNAQGWEVLVSMNASSKSKKLADILYMEAAKYFKVRPATYYQKYKSQNVGICRDTMCPAVLTENLFMDSQGDVKILKTEEGFKKIVKLHVEGIKKYIAWL